MTAVVPAATEFVRGPQVLEAARVLLERAPIPALCNALLTSATQDTEILIDAIEKVTVFEEIRMSLLCPEIFALAQQGVSSPDSRVRRLVASLVSVLAEKEEALIQLAEGGVLSAADQLIIDSDLSVAEKAKMVLQRAIRCPTGYDACFRGGDSGTGIVGKLQILLPTAGDEVKFRILSLFVALGRESNDGFALLEERGCYDQVLGAFFTDDLLLKLNTVQLVEELASYPAGQGFVGRKGVPNLLEKELVEAFDDSIKLCVVRLLGIVVSRNPGAMAVLLPGTNAPLAQAVSELMGKKDISQTLCGLNAWTDIGAHPEGLAFLMSWMEPLELATNFLGSPQNEVFKAASVGWNDVLRCGPGTDPDGPQAKVWLYADEKIVPLVLRNLSGKPFPDARSVTWRLLGTLVLHSKAVAISILGADEIREILLDFGSEENWEARVAKYEFVDALCKAQGEWLGHFLDEHVVKIIREWEKHGPSFIPWDAAAAVDRAAS